MIQPNFARTWRRSPMRNKSQIISAKNRTFLGVVIPRRAESYVGATITSEIFARGPKNAPLRGKRQNKWRSCFLGKFQDQSAKQSAILPGARCRSFELWGGRTEGEAETNSLRRPAARYPDCPKLRASATLFVGKAAVFLPDKFM